MRGAIERWQRELAPGAAGWLGATGGVADDGTFVGVVRFESEDAARRNSDRPEQGAWWDATSKLFTGEVTFRDCPDVDVHLRGGSDKAGFVQVIQGRVSDVDRMRQLNRAMDDDLFVDFRPDVIGSTAALHGDGGFTETVYFTSETEARIGELREPPPQLREVFEEEMALISDLTYLDLRDPWLTSPR
ncbi:hypothetical protein [Embleya sp. NBC_00896]|uniref:hypothetical protein n=1 Tax=Embleya sp. NBC_00896 TaxID=2975961 RepID=UPI002F909821|nr:hypothetical protein OG928_43530 [Embleya sp. NBC_00896]